VIYISKTSKFEFKERGGFYFTGGNTQLPSEYSSIAGANTSIFWKLLLEDYVEMHADSVNAINTYADTTIFQTMGALPINISARGHLYTMIKEDHRLDFLKVYNELYRGTLNIDYGIELYLFVKDTHMKFYFTGIRVDNQASNEDFTSLAFTGIGYNYNVLR
jgi:hypothetical protein